MANIRDIQIHENTNTLHIPFITQWNNISYLVNVKVSLTDTHKQSFPSFHDCCTCAPLGLPTYYWNYLLWYCMWFISFQFCLAVTSFCMCTNKVTSYVVAFYFSWKGLHTRTSIFPSLQHVKKIIFLIVMIWFVKLKRNFGRQFRFVQCDLHRHFQVVE